MCIDLLITDVGLTGSMSGVLNADHAIADRFGKELDRPQVLDGLGCTISQLEPGALACLPRLVPSRLTAPGSAAGAL
jgi:hypothetical protein